MKKELRLLLGLFLVFSVTLAQRFPVKIVPRVQAPSPVNFYNYADATSLNSPITVQLFLNDLTVSNRQIRLKTYFEGGNISFTSKEFVLGAENLFLEGGVPLTLKNTELAPYYQLENIQGIGTSVYGQSIPEGSYSFCFEVFDFLSGAKLSAKECRTVFIFKNEPPILNIPLNGTNIKPTDFENIVFQWTPRHINVSNVEYEFSLVEVWDDVVNIQTAFLSQTPIYEETTRATTILYGPAKPLLLPEKRYAWRVKAKALQGLEEIGLFKNQGFSEVFWFSRTAPCMVPENISAEPKGLSKINVFWDQDPTIHSEYVIAYREADKEYAKWFTKRTNSAWATIWNLKPGTKYEYKVKGKCKYQFSDYSKVQYVTTDIVTNDDANYNCGIVPDHIAISNREPHTGLRIGDEITAGDFLIVLTNITSQSNGRISGVGYVSIPYLQFAKFAVYYTNVLINTDNQLAEGEIVTIYDPEFGENASMTVDINFENEEEEEPVAESEGVNQDTNTSDIPTENTEVQTPENNTPTETTEGTETPPSGTGETPPPTREEIPPTDTTKTKSEDPPSSEGETGESETEKYIIYRDKKYFEGETIKIEYDNRINKEKTTFFGAKNEARIQWNAFTKKYPEGNGEYIVEGKTVNYLFQKKFSKYKLAVNFWNDPNDFPNEEEDKMSTFTVNVEVTNFNFKLIELYASDGKNSKRLAKSGQILYLLDQKGITDESRKINYSVVTDPKLKNNYGKYDIVWDYNENGPRPNFGEINIHRYLKESNEISTTGVKAGYPDKSYKKVDVLWVLEKKKVKSFANKIKNFLSFFKVVNDVSEKVSKVMPCEVSLLKDFDKNLKFQDVNFNKEDKISRHLIEVERFQFDVEASNIAKLKCGKKIKFKTFGYVIDIAEAYVQLGAGLNVSIIKDDNYYYEQHQFIDKNKFSQGGVKVSGEAGLKAGLGVKNDKGKMIVGVEGGGKVDITGGGKIIYPYKENEDLIAGELYLNPLMYSFTLTAKLGPLDKEFKHSDILWNIRMKRKVIYNMKD